MTFDVGMPMMPEAVLFGFMVLVLFVGLLRKPAAGPGAQTSTPSQASLIGWLSIVGLLVTLALTFLARENATLFSNSFVNDSLALFSKKLFTAAAALSILGSLTLRQSSFHRRASEYYFILLASVLGMMVLASARDLILLFVAFELMSIPLYVLTGFVKREDCGTGSGTQVLPGRHCVVGGDRLRHLVHHRRDGQHRPVGDSCLHWQQRPVDASRDDAAAGRPRFQDRRVPVPHVGARRVRGREHAVRRHGWLFAPKAPDSSPSSGCMWKAVGARHSYGCQSSPPSPA
jgi:hypothetical protein